MKTNERFEQDSLTARSTAIAITIAFAMLAVCWVLGRDLAFFQVGTLFGALATIVAWLDYFSQKTKTDVAAMLNEAMDNTRRHD